MLRHEFCGYVPCHSSSIRGIKRNLYPKDDAFFALQPTTNEPGQQAGALWVPNRRQFLKAGMAGAAVSCLPLSGCGGVVPAAAALAANFDFYGIAASLAVQAATELLRPALHALVEKAVLPWVNDKLAPLVQRFLNVLSTAGEEFAQFLDQWTKAGAFGATPFDNAHSDNQWYPSTYHDGTPACFTGVRTKGLDFDVGLDLFVRPLAINVREHSAMLLDQGFGFRNQYRDNFVKNWETYKAAFDLLNELHFSNGEQKIKPEEVVYAVPYQHAESGKKYTAFYINRDAGVDQFGKGRVLTTWHE